MSSSNGRKVGKRDGPTIWLARDRANGTPNGFLIMRGATIVAFVRSIDAVGLKASRQIARRPILLNDPDRREAFFCEGARVDDLRGITSLGSHLDAPIYLLANVYFPVDASGNVMPTPEGADFLSIDVTVENSARRLFVALRRAIERRELPAWMRGSNKNATKPLKLNPRTLAGKSVGTSKQAA